MPLPDWFLPSARALIRADSVSAVGNGAALEVLEPLYTRAGLPTRRFEWLESIDGAPEALHANLLAGPGGLEAGAPWGSPESREALSRGEVPASARGGVLFVTHTDTVPPGPLERWSETSGDPRALSERDGFLFGLGVADVKLDALCKIAAAERLRARKLARPFWLCGTAAEEVGLRGARRFAESPTFKSMGISQVLCGEPSELHLIRAHKGYAVVVCTVIDSRAPVVGSQTNRSLSLSEIAFTGRAAPSSTPPRGDNAIHRALAWAQSSGARVVGARGGASANTVPALCALEVATQLDSREPLPAQARAIANAEPLPDLWRALQTAGALEEVWLALLHKLAPTRDERFDPPGAVGGLNLLESASELPDPRATHGRAIVRATLDGRLLPQHDPDTLLVTFMAAAEAWVQRLGKGELTVQIEVVRNASGMSLGDDSPLVQSVSRTLQRLGRDGTPRAKPTSTEAGIFSRAGCEAIVIGPGRSTGNAHGANERIEVAQLEAAIDLYAALIEDLCGASR